MPVDVEPERARILLERAVDGFNTVLRRLITVPEHPMQAEEVVRGFCDVLAQSLQAVNPGEPDLTADSIIRRLESVADGLKNIGENALISQQKAINLSGTSGKKE